MSRVGPTAALMATLLGGAPTQGYAQAGPPRGPTGPIVHVEARDGAPVLALALVLPVGSAADPAGSEGTARVLAGALARTVASRIGPALATAQSQVTPLETRILVLALPEAGERARAALEEVAFGSGPDAESVVAELEELRSALRFEAGAPLREVEQSTRDLLFGAAAPEARPVEGTEKSLARIGPGEVEAMRRSHYRPEAAALGIVGSSGSGAAEPTVAEPAATDELAPTFTGPAPWTAGDRVRIARDVTSTWIAAGYPVPDGLPETLLGFLAHRVAEELNSTPPDPGVFSVEVAVRTHPGGRLLLVEAAVLPEAAARWESRILEAVRSLARPVPEEFFRWQRRRFRSATLEREAHPERAAARAAADLLARGSVRSLQEEVWAIQPDHLAAAAAALGPPRLLVFGPDLTGGGPPVR